MLTDRTHEVQDAGDRGHIGTTGAARQDAGATVAIQSDNGSLFIKSDSDPAGGTRANLITRAKK